MESLKKEKTIQESGVLQELYAKRFLKVLALGGTMMFAMQLAKLTSPQEEANSDQQLEMIENDLGVDELIPGAKIEVVRGGETFVVNLTQMHSDVEFDVTKESADRTFTDGLNQIINSQKHIEQTIRAFSTVHGINHVSVELTPSVWGLTELKDSKIQIEKLMRRGESQLLIDFVDLKYNEIISDGGFDCVNGPMLYLLLKSLEPYIEHEKDAADLYDVLTTNKLIAGDNIYVWGGAIKLFVEGEIDISVVEDQDEINKMQHSPQDYWDSKLSAGFDMAEVIERLSTTGGFSQDEYLQKTIKTVQSAQMLVDQRESASLNKIFSEMNNNDPKYKLVVYGIAHDFSNNIDQFNSLKGTKIGLINIM